MAHRKAYLWFQIKAISFPTNSHFRSWKWCLLNEESRIKRSWEVAPCDQRVKQSMILNQRNVNGEWSHNETSKELNRQLLDSFWYPKIRKETAPSQRFSLETMAQGPLGNVWRYWSCQNLGWEWGGGEKHVTGIQWAKVRDTAKYPTMHRYRYSPPRHNKKCQWCEMSSEGAI